MPCGHTNIPPPKLLISFPDSSKWWTGFALVPRHPGCGPRRAAVGGPDGLAIAIDGHAVGAAPRPSVDVRPIADHAIGISAAVDGLNFVGLRRASTRLRLDNAARHRNPDDDQRGEPESHGGVLPQLLLWGRHCVITSTEQSGRESTRTLMILL